MNEQRRYNRRIFLIVVTMLFISISLSAQQQQERNQPPKPPSATEVNKMVDDLSTNLSLSEAQKQKVSNLFTAHFNETRESMNNNERNVSREEMEKKRGNFEEQIKSLLNDKQKTEFDKFMKSRGPQPNQQQQKR